MREEEIKTCVRLKHDTTRRYCVWGGGGGGGLWVHACGVCVSARETHRLRDGQAERDGQKWAKWRDDEDGSGGDKDIKADCPVSFVNNLTRINKRSAAVRGADRRWRVGARWQLSYTLHDHPQHVGLVGGRKSAAFNSVDNSANK